MLSTQKSLKIMFYKLGIVSSCGFHRVQNMTIPWLTLWEVLIHRTWGKIQESAFLKSTSIDLDDTDSKDDTDPQNKI